jgi:hypothetical protein
MSSDIFSNCSSVSFWRAMCCIGWRVGVLEWAGDFIASALLWSTGVPDLLRCGMCARLLLRGVCSSMFVRCNAPKL